MHSPILWMPLVVGLLVLVSQSTGLLVLVLKVTKVLLELFLTLLVVSVISILDLFVLTNSKPQFSRIKQVSLLDLLP